MLENVNSLAFKVDSKFSQGTLESNLFKWNR